MSNQSTDHTWQTIHGLRIYGVGEWCVVGGSHCFHVYHQGDWIDSRSTEEAAVAMLRDHIRQHAESQITEKYRSDWLTVYVAGESEAHVKFIEKDWRVAVDGKNYATWTIREVAEQIAKNELAKRMVQK